MNKVLRDFFLDMGLFLLLGLDVAAVLSMPRGVIGHQATVGWHIHALVGILLTLGCLTHIGLHGRWFPAAAKGKARLKIKLGMNSMVAVMLLLAALSGHAALTSASAAGLHRVTGSIALLGLVVHAVKHARWMVLVSKRFVSGPRLA